MPDIELNRLDNIPAGYRRYAIWIIISLLPLMMFHWLLPFLSELSPGYTLSYYVRLVQSEYVFALKSGTCPLNLVWDTVQSCFPLGPLGVYHPITYIVSILPGYFAGVVIEWNVLARLLTIFISHIILFEFLRKLKASIAIAFFLSAATVYSLRILFSFYYGIGLEAWTGHLLLCSVIGFYCLEPSKIRGPLSIIGATYWLISSGHPEETYYGVLGAGIFTLVIPFFIKTILPDRITTWQAILRFWMLTLLFFLSGLLLGAVYWLPLYVEVKTIMISRQSYQESLILSDTVSGFISNFFSPIRACFAGAFGSTPLLLAVLFSPFIIFFRVKIPNVVWAILGLIVLICLCVLGNHTPVHYCFWKYFPLASSVRIPGRISLMLPVLFMLILHWLFQQKLTVLGKEIKAITITVLPALISLLVYGVLSLNAPFFQTDPSDFSKTDLFSGPQSFSNDLFFFSMDNLFFVIPSWVEPLSITSGIIILLAAAGYGLTSSRRITAATGSVLCIAACLQLLLVLRFAPLPREVNDNRDIRSFQQYQLQRNKTLDSLHGKLYFFDNNSYPFYIKQQKELYFIEPLLGKIYRKYIPADSLDQAYLLLNTQRKQNEVVVENFRDRLEVEEASSDCVNIIDSVNLKYSSYNRMIFEARACQSSFFVFSYNRTGYWRPWVNGKKAETYRANGHAHAVLIPAGLNTIEFRYWSWPAFLGMLSSCIMLSVIGLVCGLNLSRKPAGYCLAAMIIILSGGIFYLWYHSLYTGENLHTDYNWQSPGPNAPGNIAFGKTARMAIHPYADLNSNLMHQSRNGVDGGRSFTSCFVTGNVPNPWWEVDLLRPQQIETLVIYTSLQGQENNRFIFQTLDSVKISSDYNFFVMERTPVNFNQLPLTIGVSVDGRNWETTRIDRIYKDRPLTIKLEDPVTARYLRITASGECRLSLNEVEVYPPVPESTSNIERHHE